MEFEDVTELLQSHDKNFITLKESQRKWYLEIDFIPGKNAVKIIEMTTNNLEYYINLVIKAEAGFERIGSNFESSTMSKMLSYSIACYREIIYESVRGTTNWNHPPWLGKILATWTSYITVGGFGKEYGTNKLPSTRRIWERSKGGRRRQSICSTGLPKFFSLESTLVEQYMHATRKDPECQNDWPETTWKLTPSP